MAYNKANKYQNKTEKEKELLKAKFEKEIIDVIVKKKLMRFNHVFGYYAGCGRSTAYNYGLDKLDSIKEALAMNRVKGVDYLLQKWIAGDNATLQIAAMRLICTPEEHQKLNQSYIDHTTGGEKINTPDLSNISYAQLKKLVGNGDKQDSDK